MKDYDLVEKAYSKVRQMILKNKLKPGQKLIQEDLARKIGVSRTPLLSALSKLEQELLIETRPRRGYFVKKLSTREALDLYDIRLRLEPLGALGAAKNASTAQKRSLERILNRFDEGGGRQKFGELDYAFHCQIMSMSGNYLLFPILSSFYIVLFSNQMDLLNDKEPYIQDHKTIMEHILDGKAEEAETLMLKHIKASMAGLQEAYLHKG